LGSGDLTEEGIVLVLLENVVKTYETVRGPVRALDGVSLQVKEGEFVVVRGPSGSGKTSLLMIVAAILRASSGTVRVNGLDLNRMGGREKEQFRARTIGFVFQMFHLIPYLNVLENVMLAAGTVRKDGIFERAEELLDGLEMRDRIYHRPAELSTGERQRTAIARALVNDPIILLADEPTGNLDPKNADAVLNYLAGLNRRGCAVILATHETGAEQYAHKVVVLEKGRLSS